MINEKNLLGRLFLDICQFSVFIFFYINQYSAKIFKRLIQDFLHRISNICNVKWQFFFIFCPHIYLYILRYKYEEFCLCRKHEYTHGLPKPYSCLTCEKGIFYLQYKLLKVDLSFFSRKSCISVLNLK